MKSLVSYPQANVTFGSRPSYNSNSDLRFTDTNSRSWIATKLNDDRGSFMTTLVHELRNPLTNIKLSIEMLDSLIEDDNVKKILGIITRSSSRISDLINDLLKNKQDEVEVEGHSIHQLLDEALELARDRISLKNIVVIKKYEQDCKLTLNGPEMKIALTNIIVNAIDAMTTGKGQLTLITKSIESRYVVMINDNGCGISKENLQNIFKPHYTNKPGGLGIGLAATANILRSNNIRVNVESRETKGTCFILLFDRTNDSKKINQKEDRVMCL